MGRVEARAYDGLVPALAGRRSPNMKTILMTALTVVIAGLALAACEDRGDRTVGQQLDSALKRTQQHLAAAGDKIAQQTDRAVDAVKEKTQAAGSPDVRRGVSDGAITASIKTDLLKDPDLSVLKIDVDTHDGVVTLNGLAGDDEARVRAEKIAQGVKGVKEVHNYLVTKHV
jgi:osmotically-inducible protein OsmY